MQKYKNTTYTDWLDLVKEIREYGMDDDRYYGLKMSCPQDLSREWEELFWRQVSQLEEELLRVIFYRLEKGLNDALNEADAELADKVLGDYIRGLHYCSFFLSYRCSFEDHKDRLYHDICGHVDRYQKELVQFVKRTGLDYPGQLIDDILYLLEKRDPYRFVRGWNISVV